MVHKKKLKSLLKYISSFLIMFFLFMVTGVFSSNCYALTPSNEMTADDFERIVDFFMLNVPNSMDNYSSWYSIINSFNTNANYENLASDFNDFFVNKPIPTLEQMTLYPFYYNGRAGIAIVENNNTIGNSLGFVRLNLNNNTNYGIAVIDDNHDRQPFVRYTIEFTNYGGYSFNSTNINNNVNQSITIGTNMYITDTFLDTIVFYSLITRNTYYYSSNGSVYNWYWATESTVIDLPSHDLQPDPEPEPIPGGTGTITNPSGDVTGQIDLSGIQNQLGTINNSINDGVDNIIENDNQNTQSIIDSVDHLSDDINNTLTDQPNLSNTTINSGDIERCFGF